MDKDQIIAALASIVEPEYGKSLIELKLIRDVMVREGKPALTVVLVKDEEAYKVALTSQITDALGRSGMEGSHIRYRAITDYERKEIALSLGHDAPPPSAAPISRPGEPLPLLHPDRGVTFIAVASGKGGVGKSTVTVNLAAALARKGQRVGLIDADIYGFSVPDMMGIEQQPEQIDNKIQPVERFGVKVISMGFFVEDNAPIIWRGPMLGKMLRNFFGEVNWGELDYVLLDLPPGTGDIALDVHQMIPQSKEIIVTTPHATAAFVAARAGAMAKHTNHEVLGVVENMAYYVSANSGEKEYVFGRGGGARLAETLQTELLAQIPLGAPDNLATDPDFSPSVYKPEHPTGQLYDELAATVINKTKS